MRIARIATDQGPRPVIQQGDRWAEVIDPFADDPGIHRSHATRSRRHTCWPRSSRWSCWGWPTTVPPGTGTYPAKRSSNHHAP